MFNALNVEKIQRKHKSWRFMWDKHVKSTSNISWVSIKRNQQTFDQNAVDQSSAPIFPLR